MGSSRIFWVMRARYIGMLGTLAACGEVLTLTPSVEPAPDGGSDAGLVLVDARDTGACDPNAEFGLWTSVGASVNSDADEVDGRLSPDGKMLYFARTGSPPTISRAPRIGDTFEFGDPVVLREVEGAALSPALSPSFGKKNELFYSLFRPIANDPVTDAGRSQQEIWMATIGVGNAVEDAASVLAPSAPILALGAYATSGGEALYFTQAVGPARHAIFVSRRDTGNTFLPFGRVGGIDVANVEDIEDPVVTADELILYFKRSEALASAPRSSTIHRATRKARIDLFGEPQAVPSLNQRETQAPTWVSADDCTIFLSSKNADGNSDLYVARRGR